MPSPGQVAGQPGAHSLASYWWSGPGEASGPGDAPGAPWPPQSPRSKPQAWLLHAASQIPSPGQPSKQPSAHPERTRSSLDAGPGEGDGFGLVGAAVPASPQPPQSDLSVPGGHADDSAKGASIPLSSHIPSWACVHESLQPSVSPVSPAEPGAGDETGAKPLPSAQSPSSKPHASLLQVESQMPSPGQLGGQPGAQSLAGSTGAVPSQSPLSKLHAALLHVSSQMPSPGQVAGQPAEHSSAPGWYSVSPGWVWSGPGEASGPGDAAGPQSPLSKLHASLLHVASQTPSPGQLAGQPGAQSWWPVPSELPPQSKASVPAGHADDSAFGWSISSHIPS